MDETTPLIKSNPIATCIWNYKEEAEYARRNRYIQNRENFECYHLRQDYSHKKRGQSKEFLANQQMAVEQLTSFLQQGLMDFGEWFRMDPRPGVNVDELKIKPTEVRHLLSRQLEKNEFANYFNDAIKLGLLGSLMIAKVGGRMVKRAKYEAKTKTIGGIIPLLGRKRKTLTRTEKDIWQLDLSLVRQEDYFPDPTGGKLYEVQRIEMDWHELYQIAKDNPDDFDLEAVNAIPWSEDDLQKAKRARETGQNVTYSQYRRRVVLFECWGTLIERHTGQVIMENCVSTIDFNSNVIRPPKKNPFWHNESPYVACPIIRVPGSVWHRALMDGPTRYNNAKNELFNLTLDASLMEVHGIKQLRASWLENPGQVQNGIAPGETLLVNSQCPPGAHVLERIDTSAVTPEAINVMSILDKEIQEAALTNDTRSGNLPSKSVKATEVVSANQSLTGIMNGIVKVIEENFVSKVLDKSWLTMAQHMNDLDSEDIEALVGPDRARLIANLSPEEVFADSALKHDYKVFGLSMTLNKIQDFRKIQTLLQTIGASPQMMQEFFRKYSMTKLLGEVIKSLDIDEDKILTTPEEQAQRLKEQQQQMMMQAQAEAAANPQQPGPGQNTNGGQGGNPQSQIPQMMNRPGNEGIAIQRGANNIGMTNPS